MLLLDFDDSNRFIIRIRKLGRRSEVELYDIGSNYENEVRWIAIKRLNVRTPGLDYDQRRSVTYDIDAFKGILWSWKVGKFCSCCCRRFKPFGCKKKIADESKSRRFQCFHYYFCIWSTRHFKVNIRQGWPIKAINNWYRNLAPNLTLPTLEDQRFNQQKSSDFDRKSRQADQLTDDVGSCILYLTRDVTVQSGYQWQIYEHVFPGSKARNVCFHFALTNERSFVMHFPSNQLFERWKNGSSKILRRFQKGFSNVECRSSRGANFFNFTIEYYTFQVSPFVINQRKKELFWKTTLRLGPSWSSSQQSYFVTLSSNSI